MLWDPQRRHRRPIPGLQATLRSLFALFVAVAFIGTLLLLGAYLVIMLGGTPS